MKALQAKIYHRYWQARFFILKNMDRELTYPDFMENPWCYMANLLDRNDPHAYANLQERFSEVNNDDVRDALSDFDYEVSRADEIYSTMLKVPAGISSPYTLH